MVKKQVDHALLSVARGVAEVVDAIRSFASHSASEVELPLGVPVDEIMG